MALKRSFQKSSINQANPKVNQVNQENEAVIMVPFTQAQIGGLMGYLYEANKGVQIFLDLDKKFNEAINKAKLNNS